MIVWTSVLGLGSGAGQTMLPRKEAERLAHELNKAHPDFAHLAVNTEKETAGEALVRLHTLLTKRARLQFALQKILRCEVSNDRGSSHDGTKVNVAWN